MIKQILLIILLSAAAIFFQSELSHVIDFFVNAHQYVDKTLHSIFSQGQVGQLIQDMISLLILPFLGGLLLAALFWLVKRTSMPHTMGVVWVLWLVLLISLLVQAPGPAPVKTPAAPQTVSETQE